MKILKDLAYITACLLLCIAWLIAFVTGYMLQHTWEGALCIGVDFAISVMLLKLISGRGIEGNKKDGDKEMMHNEYMYNSRFRDYVDKYCKTYGYTVDEALTHELIRQVYLYYTEV